MIADGREDQHIIFRSGSLVKKSRALKRKTESSRDWIFDFGFYKRQNCGEVFLQAEKIMARKIWMGYNSHARILKDIINVSFVDLLQLGLSQNNIESIQILSRLHCPNLEEIWLRQNIITNLNPLKKCNWPNIKVASLYNNKILGIECLSQFYSPVLNTLWTQHQYNERVQGEDMSWLLKMESIELRVICAGSLSRLYQVQVDCCLSRKIKHNQLKIYRKSD